MQQGSVYASNTKILSGITGQEGKNMRNCEGIMVVLIAKELDEREQGASSLLSKYIICMYGILNQY